MKRTSRPVVDDPSGGGVGLERQHEQHQASGDEGTGRGRVVELGRSPAIFDAVVSPPLMIENERLLTLDRIRNAAILSPTARRVNLSNHVHWSKEPATRRRSTGTGRIPAVASASGTNCTTSPRSAVMTAEAPDWITAEQKSVRAATLCLRSASAGKKSHRDR